MQVFKTLANKISAAGKKFDQDQDGMETMQIVMIIAVAAIVLLFVKNQWSNISGWADGLISQVTSWNG